CGRWVGGQRWKGVVVGEIIVSDDLGGDAMNHLGLVVVLAFEAGLLLVAANTGFLGGPAVLANMAVDSWMPHQFRNLSSRLVTQNGVILMGAAAAAVLLITGGKVSVPVGPLYIHAFPTFHPAARGPVRHL